MEDLDDDTPDNRFWCLLWVLGAAALVALAMHVVGRLLAVGHAANVLQFGVE